MKIISTFLPASVEALTDDRPTVMMAFDTLMGQKSYVVGITVGSMQGVDLSAVRVSPVGQAIIARCSAHMAANYPNGTVVLAGVAKVPGAKERVRQVLTKAPEHSFVLFVCANDKVYDAAFPALGVDYQSASQQSH